MIQQSLTEILRAENGEVDSKAEWEKQKKASAAGLEALKQSKEGKRNADGKIEYDVYDFLAIGGGSKDGV